MRAVFRSGDEWIWGEAFTGQKFFSAAHPHPRWTRAEGIQATVRHHRHEHRHCNGGGGGPPGQLAAPQRRAATPCTVVAARTLDLGLSFTRWDRACSAGLDGPFPSVLMRTPYGRRSEMGQSSWPQIKVCRIRPCFASRSPEASKGWCLGRRALLHIQVI